MVKRTKDNSAFLAVKSGLFSLYPPHSLLLFIRDPTIFQPVLVAAVIAGKLTFCFWSNLHPLLTVVVGRGSYALLPHLHTIFSPLHLCWLESLTTCNGFRPCSMPTKMFLYATNKPNISSCFFVKLSAFSL